MSAPCSDGGEQALGLVHGSGQVGIGKHDHLAESLKQAGADAVAFAAVAGVFEETDFRGGAGKVKDHLAVESVEPSLTTMTSASQPWRRMQATPS